MALSKHVNITSLLQESRDDPHHHGKGVAASSEPETTGAYTSRYGTKTPLPKHRLPTHGVGADAAYQLVHDELLLDGIANLNLASFVHTWMPEQANKLMVENMSINLIDGDEYPAVQAIQSKCVNMLANLWHAPRTSEAVGTPTTGSSEAIMLGGMALKRNWQAKMKAAGKDIHNPGPNIIMGANAQVALEKFARYFEVEARLVPVSEESRYCLDPKKAIEMCDENTIGVFVILGSTYTGHYEPVEEMSKLLDEYQEKTGIDIPIHVDGASGAFVAPFAHPKVKFDFQLPRVVSINTSGHKFGLAYVGVGWVIFRDKAHLPKDMVFELHYLGSVEYTFSLNFSRPAAPIITQYWSLIHLGFEGYRRVALGDFENARLLSRALERTGYFYVLSDIHRPVANGSKDVTDVEHYVPGLPVVAFRFTDDFKARYPHVEQKWVQTLLRAKQWIVPNYELPPSLETVEILRVVVRESFTVEYIADLVEELIHVVESLTKSTKPDHTLRSLLTGSSTRRSSGFKGEERMDGAHKATGYSRPC